MQLDLDDPMMTLRPSRPRFFLSLGIQVVLGVLLVYIALTTPPEVFGWQLFLLGFGSLILGAAARSWSAADGSITLTKEGLFDQDGTAIARFEEIASIDRSVFSFKPSNGFLIRMNARQKRGWIPGMWWRFGKRVGIGGVLPGSQTKLIADTLSAMIAAREGHDL